MLKEVSELLSNGGFQAEFSPSVKHMLSREGFSEGYGAREIKRKTEDPLTDLILADPLTDKAKIRVSIRNGVPQFAVTRETADACTGLA